MKVPVKFRNGSGLTLRGFVNVPKVYDSAVVFLHGFPASCRYIVSKRIGRDLGDRGFLVLRFDFSGTDSSDGKFEDKTIKAEVEDLGHAIDFMHDNFDFRRLILIGHSTGAVDAALYAHTDKRVDKLVLLGGVGNLKDAVRYDFTEEQVRDFLTKGYALCKRGGGWASNKKIKRRFYDDFFVLDVLGSLRKYRGPVLVVHGSDDEMVPPEKDARELYSSANEPKKMVLVKGADHKFTNPDCWREVIAEITRFIKED